MRLKWSLKRVYDDKFPKKKQAHEAYLIAVISECEKRVQFFLYKILKVYILTIDAVLGRLKAVCIRVNDSGEMLPFCSPARLTPPHFHFCQTFLKCATLNVRKRLHNKDSCSLCLV